MSMNFCEACKEYTLKSECPKCNGFVRCAHPARFSPEDKFSKYRLATKQKYNLLPMKQTAAAN